MIDVPSPAIAFVGRHNSGKTTLVEKLIAELVSRGCDVGAIKHHSHVGFDIDYPGKDSYRHRMAGANDVVIASPDMVARIQMKTEETECRDILHMMPGHDIVVVEGYRKSGLPCFEIMRAGNQADSRVAKVFAEGARAGLPLGSDFTQLSRALRSESPSDEISDDIVKAAVARAMEEMGATADCGAVEGSDMATKLPTCNTVGVITDIPEAVEAAQTYGIPAFPLDDVVPLADYLWEHYVRPRVTVVIQAGGESRRMGRSKATVPFAGRPLICRLIERVSPVADELVITTNEPENLKFVHEMYPDRDIQLVSDEYPFRGALPGLYTALQAASNPFVAIVACDMLFASPSLIVAEAIEMAETNADVVVPVNKHGYEPFHAMYRRRVCLPHIRETLEGGSRRAQSFFDKVNVVEYPQARVLEAEPMGGCFINANTPEELHAFEESFIELN